MVEEIVKEIEKELEEITEEMMQVDVWVLVFHGRIMVVPSMA